MSPVICYLEKENSEIHLESNEDGTVQLNVKDQRWSGTPDRMLTRDDQHKLISYFTENLKHHRDKTKMTDSYYQLPRDGRWLPNACEVGGRSTDVSQLGYSLQSALKDAYAINDVPLELEAQAAELVAHLSVSDRLLEEFVEAVSAHQLTLSRENKEELTKRERTSS